MDLLRFDIRTVVCVLFWGNLISTVLIYLYTLLHEDDYDKKFISMLFKARSLETLYYLLIFYKGCIPDILAINVSMSLIFISLYLNGYLLLVLSNNTERNHIRNLRIILICAIVIFNITSMFATNQLCSIIAVVCMLAILAIPIFKLFFSKNIRTFTYITASIYVVLLMVASLRSVYTVMDEAYVFTDNVIQSVTYLAQYLNVVFSTPAMLLIFKDRTDKNFERLASIDGLTGIPNRVSFLKETQKYFDENKDLGREVSILFLDIDFFKRVNDTFGHAFGDEVLIQFASVLEKNIRKDDINCRYGGEEFLIIMKNSDEAAAVSLAERIMAQVRALRFESQPDFCFSVSIGIYSGIISNGNKLDFYIDKADKAMYLAKNSGRDKIVIYSEVLE